MVGSVLRAVFQVRFVIQGSGSLIGGQKTQYKGAEMATLVSCSSHMPGGLVVAVSKWSSSVGTLCAPLEYKLAYITEHHTNTGTYLFIDLKFVQGGSRPVEHGSDWMLAHQL